MILPATNETILSLGTESFAIFALVNAKSTGSNSVAQLDKPSISAASIACVLVIVEVVAPAPN